MLAERLAQRAHAAEHVECCLRGWRRGRHHRHAADHRVQALDARRQRQARPVDVAFQSRQRFVVRRRILAQVEQLRRIAIARREQGEPVDTLAARLAGVPLADAEALVRAFAAYFGATNLAERVHRIRRRRDYQRQGGAPQPGGLHAVLHELRVAGVRLAELQALLARMHVEPVFTAHPTEAIRRALLLKERTVVERLVADIDRTRTPPERGADDARIRQALTTAWQTTEAPPHKPSVADEVEHIGFYLSSVLYRVLPVFYESFADAVEAVYGERIALPPLLRFGSWVGGDMDGNPNVGAASVGDALAAQRALALSCYQADLRALGDSLTQSRGRIGFDAEIETRAAAHRALFAEGAVRSRPRLADMPYRQLLWAMRARLHATAGDSPGGYPDAAAFIDDLELIDASLARHQGDHAGRFALQRVLWRAKTFGLHMAALDLRQELLGHLFGQHLADHRAQPAHVVAQRGIGAGEFEFFA